MRWLAYELTSSREFRYRTDLDERAGVDVECQFIEKNMGIERQESTGGGVFPRDKFFF